MGNDKAKGKDNRIPDVVHDFVAPERPTGDKSSVLSFLLFEDWFKGSETEAKDWVVVARSQRIEQSEALDDLFTFSVLADAAEGNREKILASSEWDVEMAGFGIPAMISYGDGSPEYDPGVGEEVDGVKYSPFVIFRDFHNYVPNTFELVQSFHLFHNTFFDRGSKEFRRLDDNGETHPVARIKQESDNLLVLVDVHHLRDYLAANGCFLVRYHDHRRFSEMDISPQLEDSRLERTISTQASRFDLVVTSETVHPEYEAFSSLMGKDLLMPYSAPDKRHTSWLDEEKDFATFIIGRDGQGQEVVATCNERKLSNYYADRGTPHFLTPVFFRREVLAKYYNEPSRYSVDDSSVKCLSLWHLPIDITAEDLVQVWLGDLGRVPYKEQMYWRQYNVSP
ncbi:MAG TPA: hypothetical protein VKT52_00310, partial [Ktedonobacterales bacterium]|nr:hypothetical protein [Ktedonobacterales bacterium]